jgi:hypothetical protein
MGSEPINCSVWGWRVPAVNGVCLSAMNLRHLTDDLGSRKDGTLEPWFKSRSLTSLIFLVGGCTAVLYESKSN